MSDHFLSEGISIRQASNGGWLVVRGCGWNGMMEDPDDAAAFSTFDDLIIWLRAQHKSLGDKS